MPREPRDLIEFQLRQYLEQYPDLRFGQALFNLDITQFVDKKNPSAANQHWRDIYNDTDEAILKRMKASLKGKYTLKEFCLPDADLMLLHEFANAVREGAFTNYDGWGYYATKDKETEIIIRPNHVWDDIVDLRVDEKLTHVMWYNR
jgi:hypothetical protein